LRLLIARLGSVRGRKAAVSSSGAFEAKKKKKHRPGLQKIKAKAYNSFFLSFLLYPYILYTLIVRAALGKAGRVELPPGEKTTDTTTIRYLLTNYETTQH
jgi:hypothetical protein